METGIEFFFHVVAMERILVVFLRIQRKSIKRRQAKVFDRTGQTRCLQNFAENPQTNGFHVFILFCYR